MKLSELKNSFNGSIGLNVDALFDELDRLADKMGVDTSEPLTEAFLKQAKQLYSAHIGRLEAQIAEYGFKEVLGFFKTGRVPKRPKRVGASTA